MNGQKRFFIKGFTYGYDGRRGMYRLPEAALSRERLSALGGDWAALAFAVMQDSFSSTRIRPDYRFTVTDKDISEAVNHLHALGLRVCMKPMVNCMDGVWRARISFPEPEWGDKDYWGEWFSSYTAFLCHYAEIAEETGCELFCMGCEMLGAEHKEAHWRKAVEAVRQVYHGPLVYNTNHGKEQNVTWWDAVDFIGTSAYYRVADAPGASVESMRAEWDRHKKSLSELSQALGKQIIFMEIGCRSAKGCAMMPYDFSHREFPYDENEQANFYESCFLSLWDEPWFSGFFWWDWPTVLRKRDPDLGFCIADKKAEQIVKKWYHNERTER